MRINYLISPRHFSSLFFNGRGTHFGNDDEISVRVICTALKTALSRLTAKESAKLCFECKYTHTSRLRTRVWAASAAGGADPSNSRVPT